MESFCGVKLEKDRLYILKNQDSSERLWIDLNNLDINLVNEYINQLDKLFYEMTSKMNPSKAEGVRSKKPIKSDEYNRICDSETDVAIREDDTGNTVMRVKKPDPFIESHAEVDEDWGFETEKTEDEDEFLSGLGKTNKNRKQMARERNQKVQPKIQNKPVIEEDHILPVRKGIFYIKAGYTRKGWKKTFYPDIIEAKANPNSTILKAVIIKTKRKSKKRKAIEKKLKTKKEEITKVKPNPNDIFFNETFVYRRSQMIDASLIFPMDSDSDE
ncbi:hypothetical protein TCON_0736 [Astathelohania contejeani]|uniref:Uncharacterized protein n=1 Tax=Astathelohania contejeani TaxID=164912 RepID=A0ABQ7I0X1_9MICR|nr:hypothetical protein TCON_0736 [Thelohania contejeani]